MFRRVILLVMFCVSALCVNAQWVRSAKSRAYTRANAIVSDNTGAVYTVGSMTCVTSFETDTLRNNSCLELGPPAFTNPRVDMFLSKHDQDGKLIWIRQYLGGQGNKLFVNDIDLDDTGNIYVTGAFTDSLIFNTTYKLYNADATTELFLAKIKSDGSVDWVATYPVNNLSEVVSQKLAVTPDGVYITGYAMGDFQIGAFVGNADNNASFVSAFKPDGTPRWTKAFKEINTNGTSIGKAIEASGDSLWVFSSFADSILVENDTIVAPAGLTEGGIVMLYDNLGNVLDSAVTSTPFIEGMEFHVPNRRLYLTGRAVNATSVDGTMLFPSAGTRAFVSSHNADFSLNWVVPIMASTTTSLTGLDVVVNKDGSVMAGGTFTGASLNGNATIAIGSGEQNGFVMKIDTNGTDKWLQTFGGEGDDAVVSISSLDDSRIFVSGYFDTYVRSVGEEIFAPDGASNGFILRVDTCPQLTANMLSSDIRLCAQESALFQVTDNAAYTYQWYQDDNVVITGATTSSITVTDAGEYRASITGLGCSKPTPRVRLDLNPLPEKVLHSFDPLENCVGDSIKISASQAEYHFEWFDGATPLSIPDTVREMTFFSDGDYHLRLTDTLNCVALTDTLRARFHAYPSDIITPLAGQHLVCRGDSLKLGGDASIPGMTYLWRRNDIPMPNDTASFYVAKTSGTYSVVVTNSEAGCSTESQSNTVAIVEPPLVDFQAGSEAICQGGEPKTLVNSYIMNQTYQWTFNGIDITGATTYSYDAIVSGAFRVRVKNILCEQLSDVFYLTVNPLPEATITNPTDFVACVGTPHTLHVKPASNYTYQWLQYNQPIAGEIQQDFDVLQTGDYSVRVTNQFNCTVTSPQSKTTFNISPPANITPQGATTFCIGNAVQLRANDGSNLTYKWFRDGTPLIGETQFNLQVETSGLYEVQVKNSNSCSQTSAGILVTAVPIPEAILVSSSSENTICDRDSLLLSTNNNSAYNYMWFHNGHLITTETTSELYSKVAGDYQVIISQGACHDTSGVVTLKVLSNPLPIIKRDVEFFSIALFGDIQWFLNGNPVSGANQQAILPEQDGVYTVRVINSLGCKALSDPLRLCLPIPELMKTNDVLKVSIEASGYKWEYGNIPIEGAVSREITAQQSGSYTAIVTSADGCIMETYPVTVCVPSPSVTRDDFSGVLYAFPNPALSYQWYHDGEIIPNGTTQVNIPDNAGSYTVMVTDIEGCTSLSEPFVVSPITNVPEEKNINVNVYPNPLVNELTVSKNTNINTLSLIIVNALGQQLVQIETSEDFFNIDFTDMVSGIYSIIVGYDNKTDIIKVVKM